VEKSDAKRALRSGGDDVDDTKCEEFPGGVERNKLHPSFFSVPVVGLKALRAWQGRDYTCRPQTSLLNTSP
jgi:hypothetical protein